jgi:hypothetical protein
MMRDPLALQHTVLLAQVVIVMQLCIRRRR